MTQKVSLFYVAARILLYRYLISEKCKNWDFYERTKNSLENLDELYAVTAGILGDGKLLRLLAVRRGRDGRKKKKERGEKIIKGKNV